MKRRNMARRGSTRKGTSQPNIGTIYTGRTNTCHHRIQENIILQQEGGEQVTVVGNNWIGKVGRMSQQPLGERVGVVVARVPNVGAL